tara:strand:+ start:341 stop:817 length:477 start_codon:yes stop_codon:yes gene_type:complete
MRFVESKHIKILYIILYFLFLSNCQLSEPKKTHGINFLENRTSVLLVNKTNKNDVVKIIGRPHSISSSDSNKWIYIERTLSKGKYHQLGKNILKENNVLELYFDKYGILKEKKFYNKENMNKVKFAKQKTKNNVAQKSFVNKLFSSVRQKMYGQSKAD